jgi:hypothetical protein
MQNVNVSPARRWFWYAKARFDSDPLRCTLFRASLRGLIAQEQITPYLPVRETAG